MQERKEVVSQGDDAIAAHKAQDDKFQADLKSGIKVPPCPRCGGEMRHWDAWLVTGSTCTVCDWSYSEGSGCLL